MRIGLNSNREVSNWKYEGHRQEEIQGVKERLQASTYCTKLRNRYLARAGSKWRWLRNTQIPRSAPSSIVYTLPSITHPACPLTLHVSLAPWTEAYAVLKSTSLCALDEPLLGPFSRGLWQQVSTKKPNFPQHVKFPTVSTLISINRWLPRNLYSFAVFCFA